MAQDKEYRLGRDYLSGVRLNLQQYCWKYTLGYIIHPAIPLNNPNIRIADVGTATGLFLVDLSLCLPPSVQLHGFDISDAQFPISEYLPSNVRLYKQDGFVEPPPHLQGQYDVVHLRLFMSSIFQGKPEPLISHVFKLLKPGGYIQWDEHSPNDYQAVSHNGSPTENLQDFLNMSIDMMTKNDRPMDWIENLPEILQSEGFDVIAKEAPREPLWQRRMNTEGICVLAEEFATNFWDKYEPQGKDGDSHSLVAKMSNEVNLGSSISQAYRVVVARKRLE